MSDKAKIALCWTLACLLAVAFLQISGAADITPGYTFSPAEKNITDVKLNAATAGTVATTFYTSKSSDTAVNADTLLFYSSSAGGFRKTTVQTFFNNVPQLTTLGALNSTGDFAVNTSKFTASATTGNTAVGGNLTVATNASVTGTLGVIGVTTLGNLVSTNAQSFSGGALISGNWAFVGSTITTTGPLVVNANQTNTGSMVMGDAAADTITINGTLAGTLQGTPTVSLTSVTLDASNDKVLIQDASDSSKLKIASLSGALLNTYSNQYAFDTTLKDSAHSLGDYPDMVRWSIVCTNATLGFAVGDEVDIASLVDSAKYGVWYSAGANSSNVFCAFESSTLYLRNKTNATAGVTSTASTNWNLRVRAVKKP